MISRRKVVGLTAIVCIFALSLSACNAKNQEAGNLAETMETNAPAPVSTVAPTVESILVDLSEYVGYYLNGNYDTVTIEKNGDEYMMSVSIYRLTSLDEGTVTASSEGVVFHTIDEADNSMIVSFHKEGAAYVLRVDESTWPLLEQGTVIGDLEKVTPEEIEARYRSADDEFDALAQSGILPPYGEGQIGFRAVVLCERLTLRQEPNAASKAVKSLHYGDFLLVQQQVDGWAECFLSDDVDAGPAGWVSLDYIIIDPAWYRTNETTPVFAWNDVQAPKVALLDKDVTLPILKDEGEWLIVSLRGATGWIHKTEADMLASRMN